MRIFATLPAKVSNNKISNKVDFYDLFQINSFLLLQKFQTIKIFNTANVAVGALK